MNGRTDRVIRALTYGLRHRLLTYLLLVALWGWLFGFPRLIEGRYGVDPPGWAAPVWLLVMAAGWALLLWRVWQFLRNSWRPWE